MTLAIAFCRVAALCLLALPTHAATLPAPAVPAAEAGAPVPATRYQPTAYQTPAPPSATPDRAWREQNRIVAAYDSMMLTMPGDGGHGAHNAHGGPQAQHATPQAAGADPHAGHDMKAPATDPHAGHHMHPATAPASPVARFVAASNAAGANAGPACCKGMGKAHAGMAMGAASPAQCGQGAPGSAKGAATDGSCCKDGCCGMTAASAPAPAAHQHGGQH